MRRIVSPDRIERLRVQIRTNNLRTEMSFACEPVPSQHLRNKLSAQQRSNDSTRNLGVLAPWARNNITDSGAWAVGQFMAHSSQAVHEVHLSHNSISEEGKLGEEQVVKDDLCLATDRCCSSFGTHCWVLSCTARCIRCNVDGNAMTSQHGLRSGAGSIPTLLKTRAGGMREAGQDCTAESVCGIWHGLGFSPIWLRLEHNCIDWRLVDHRPRPTCQR